MKNFINFILIWMASQALNAQVCIPTYSSGTYYGDYISYVKLNQLSYATGASNNPYYTEDTTQTTTLRRNQTYYLVFAPGSYSNNNLAAWIDFNHNDTFENNEKLGQRNGVAAFTQDSVSFLVPVDAYLGKVRLRVREAYNVQNISACGGEAYGETEDYFITLDSAQQNQQNNQGPIRVTATSGQTGPVYYTSLVTVADSILQGTHQGNIFIEILADIQENQSIIWRASGSGQSNWNSIRLQPSGGFTRNISAQLNTTLMEFRGARNIYIHGLNSGGNKLTFENTGQGMVMQFTQGASVDTIKRCTFKGAVTDTLTGIVDLAGGGQGNDSVFIGECQFMRSVSNPHCLFTSSSSLNDFLTLDWNNFTNCQKRAIFLHHVGKAPYLLLNSIYAEDTLTSFEGISVLDGSDIQANYNYIGYADAGGSGYFHVNGSLTAIRIETPQSGTRPIEISGNRVGNFIQINSGNVYLYGIYAKVNTSIHIEYNEIGDHFRVNSIQNYAKQIARGIYVEMANADSNILVTGNTIENFSMNSSNVNAKFRGIEVRGAGRPKINQNEIHDFTSSTRRAGTWHPDSASFAGILVDNACLYQEINENTMDDIYSWGTTTQPVTVLGIALTGGGAGSVNMNGFYNMNNTSDNTNSILSAIYLHEQSDPGYVLSNNIINLQCAISMSKGTLSGIAQQANEDTVLLINNTIYLGGQSPGTSPSYGYLSFGTAPSYLRNNLIINSRIGNGRQYILGFPSNKNNFLDMNPGCNFNIYITRDTARFAELDTLGRGVGMWKQLTGDDQYSSWFNRANVQENQIFINLYSPRLRINTANSVCWLLNGRGIAGQESRWLDVDIIGNARPVQCGIGSDVGAQEFTPQNGVMAPDLNITGTHQTGGTEYFWSGSRLVASITWGNQGTLPTFGAGDAKFYSGKYPENGVPGSKASHGYWFIEPDGGNNFTYTITLYYHDGMLGTIASEDRADGAKRPAGGNWTPYAACQHNQNLNTIALCNLNSFSEFALTDEQAPLPIEFMELDARWDNQEALLTMIVSDQKEISHYVCYVSLDNQTWTQFDAFSPINVDMGVYEIYCPKRYLNKNAAVYYFRIDVKDLLGQVVNTKSAHLNPTQNLSSDIHVYPNPCTNTCQLDIPNHIQGDIHLKLVNLSGQVILQKTEQVLNGGTIPITWNQQVTPGVYFIEMAHPLLNRKVSLFIQ